MSQSRRQRSYALIGDFAGNNIFPMGVKLRIRFSLDNLKLDGDVLNIPLFMADQAKN